MTEKIINIFGTKYFYLSLRKDMEYFINGIKTLQDDPSKPMRATSKVMDSVFKALASGEEITIDIADARFTPDTAGLLMTMMHLNIHIVDTLAKWRNSLMVENQRRLSLAPTNAIPLPEMTFTTKITDYISSLQTDCVYTNITLPARINYPLVALISAVRPDINIELHDEDKFFRYINGKINPVDFDKYNKFYVCSVEGTRIFDFAEGDIHIQDEGYLNKQQAMSVATLVPIDFGSVPVINNPVYSTLVKDAMNRIRSYQNQRPKTLAELFERL